MKLLLLRPASMMAPSWLLSGHTLPQGVHARRHTRAKGGFQVVLHALDHTAEGSSYLYCDHDTGRQCANRGMELDPAQPKTCSVIDLWSGQHDNRIDMP